MGSYVEYGDFDYHRIDLVHPERYDGILLNYASALALDKGNLSLGGCTDTRIYMADKSNSFRVGSTSKVDDCGVVFKGRHNVVIIEDGCNLNRIFFYFRGDNNTVRIGKNTRAMGQRWGDVSIVCNGESRAISIGIDCLISGNIVIRNCDGHSIVNKDGEKVEEYTDINIGNHVWICENTRMYKHSGIGNNCIVAGSSVVTKSFKEDGVVVGGNPARILKQLEGTWAV